MKIGTEKDVHNRSAEEKRRRGEGGRRKVANAEEVEARLDSGCSLCGGHLLELGTLGFLTHFRCRECGAEQSL